MRGRLGTREKVPLAFNDDNISFCSFDGFEQVEIPRSRIPPVLHLRNLSKMEEYPGGRRLYQCLHQRFSWPNMSSECYPIVKSCVVSRTDNPSLEQQKILLITETAPLELVEIDIQGQLPARKR